MVRVRAASGGWLGLAALRRLGGGDSLVLVLPGGQLSPHPKWAGACLGHLSSRQRGTPTEEVRGQQMVREQGEGLSW